MWVVSLIVSKVTLHPDLPETLCTLKTFGDKTPIYSFYNLQKKAEFQVWTQHETQNKTDFIDCLYFHSFQIFHTLTSWICIYYLHV